MPLLGTDADLTSLLRYTAMFIIAILPEHHDVQVLAVQPGHTHIAAHAASVISS
jgi:hypothetical protein